MSASGPAVALAGVTQRFGYLTALHDIHLELAEGRALALLGPNGAGKTTLLRLVATLGKPTEGRVLIRGIDTRREPERVRAQIGLISHQTLLYEDLTARENLRFYGRLYGLGNAAGRIQDALDAVGLTGRENDRVRGFSRGMKQRLAIARATLHDPSILLLDEPFTGLDVSARAMLGTMLDGLRREGRTLILVTHDLGQAAALSDGFVILTRGRVTARGRTEDSSLAQLELLYEQAVSGIPAG